MARTASNSTGALVIGGLSYPTDTDSRAAYPHGCFSLGATGALTFTLSKSGRSILEMMEPDEAAN